MEDQTITVIDRHHHHLEGFHVTDQHPDTDQHHATAHRLHIADHHLAKDHHPVKDRSAAHRLLADIQDHHTEHATMETQDTVVLILVVRQRP